MAKSDFTVGIGKMRFRRSRLGLALFIVAFAPAVVGIKSNSHFWSWTAWGGAVALALVAFWVAVPYLRRRDREEKREQKVLASALPKRHRAF